MNRTYRPSALRLAVVFSDEHLIEIEAVVGDVQWCGTSAYTRAQDIGTFAVALQDFADGASADADFVAGNDSGIGLVALRFYRVDQSGHIACYLRLAGGNLSNDCRPEQVFRFSKELHAEAWAVIQFARQLGEVARTLSGHALLQTS